MARDINETLNANGATVNGPGQIGSNFNFNFYGQTPPRSEQVVLQCLQNSLRARYQQYTFLERLFDESRLPIADSFINLALIKETEYRAKEKGLASSVVRESDEKNDDGGNTKPYVDERMASHEQLYAVKEPLALTELFDPKDDTHTPNKILILGRAGIGKSILCQYLATQWACESKDEQPVGDYLREKFDAVFWLKLREVADKTKAENTLTDVIDEFCLQGLKKDRPTKKELSSYIEEHTHKVLFILDGYDEITDHIDQPAYAPLSRLLGEITAHHNVLLTSRPLAIDALGNKRIQFDRRLENMGFLNENIEDYVEKFMQGAKTPEKAAPMLQFLKSHPGAWGIAHIPINLELLSWLWSKRELAFTQGEIITLSKLYQTIVDRLQDAYNQKGARLSAPLIDQQPQVLINVSNGDIHFEGELEAKGNVQIGHYTVVQYFHSLRGPATPLTVSDCVNTFLEYLAYRAMKAEPLLISARALRAALEKTLTQYQLPTKGDQPDKLLKVATNKLGFLRATSQGGRAQLDQDHYFIHSSFQEFYAAKYITRIFSEQPHSEEAEHIFHRILTEKYTPRYQLMLWMTAGLLYQQGKKNQQFSPLLHFWRAVLSQPRDMIGYHHMVLVMHCLDECEADEQIDLHSRLIRQQLRWFEVYAKQWLHGDLYIEQLTHCSVLHISTPIISGFLQFLQNFDSRVKQKAIEVLSRLKNPSNLVIAALLDTLKDEEEWVRHTSVEALGKLNNSNEAVIQALLSVLQDEKGHVRRVVVEVLGKFNPTDVVLKALLSILNDKEEDVRKYAADALSKAHNLDNGTIQLLLDILKNKEEHTNIRITAAKMLGTLESPNDAVVQVVASALKDKEKDVRREVSHLLSKLSNLDKTMVQELVDALQDEEKEVRKNVIEILGNLNNPSEVVIAALLTVLQNEEWVDCHLVVEALGKLSNLSDVAMQALLSILQNERWYMRRAALRTLGRLNNFNDTGMRTLLDVLQDEEEMPLVRIAVVDELSSLDNPNDIVVSALLCTLQDKDDSVRGSAAEGLGKLSGSNDIAMQALLSALNDKNGYVRLAAVQGLGTQKKLNKVVVISLVKVLLGALQDKDASIRKKATKLLAELNNPNESMITGLLSASQDKEEEIRRISVNALSQLDNLDKAVSARMLSALKDKDKDVRLVAVKALGKLSNPPMMVIQVLLSTLQDQEPQVKHDAARALDKLSDSNNSVIQALQNVLQGKNRKYRYELAEGLVRLSSGIGKKAWIAPGEVVIQALLSTLRDNEIELLLTVILHLPRGMISKLDNPSEALVRGLVNILRDKNSLGYKYRRLGTVMIVGELNKVSEAVIEGLLDLFEDKDAQLTQRVTRTLSALKPVQSMKMLFERLIGTKQGSNYFSYWIEQNYFLFIDYNRREVVGRSENRQIYHIPLSFEHLVALEKQIIAVAKEKNRPLEIYYPSGYDSGHEEKSVLQENKPVMPTRFFSNAVWAVHLVCKKNSQRAFLVIEGMTEERCVAQCYEFVLPQSNYNPFSGFFSVGSDQTGRVVKTASFLDELNQHQTDYHCKSWDIEPAVGEKLLQSLEADMAKPLPPQTLDNSLDAVVSAQPLVEQQPPCLMWAQAKLKAIGLSVEGRWTNFIVAAPSPTIAPAKPRNYWLYGAGMVSAVAVLGLAAKWRSDAAANQATVPRQ